MEDEEDDFYDPADSVPTGEVGAGVQNGASNPLQETDVMDEEEEEVEDDDVCSQAHCCSESIADFEFRTTSTSSQRHLLAHPLSSRKQRPFMRMALLS